MPKKQKKVLYRIIISLVLLIAVSIIDTLVELPMIAQVILYLIPYFIIGYDILRKAGKGILNRQVFDENFLMAVATVGADSSRRFPGRQCRYAFLSDRRIVPKFRGWKEPKKHHGFDGYPS